MISIHKTFNNLHNMKNKSQIKLFIPLICYNRSCHTDYMMSILKLYDYVKRSGLSASFYPIFWDSLVSRARNAASAHFLKEDHTHLLFIDSDISFEPSDVQKLIEADKDVICSPYPKKYIMPENIKNNKEPVDFAVSGQCLKISENLYEMDSVATGFLLIKRNVFERMIKSYPEIEYINDMYAYGMGDKMWDFFRVSVNQKTKVYESEDWGFCTAWKNIGGKVYARTDISLAHWGWNEYKGNFNKWIIEHHNSNTKNTQQFT